MGVWSALTPTRNPAYNTKTVNRSAKAAKTARRGGSAVVASTRKAQSGKVTRTR
jgi:hypothetical protein